jgi:signal transduction histidine kinase
MRERLRQLPAWARYASAVVLAAIAVGLRVLMDRLLTPEIHAFLFFYPAIVVAAIYFGVGPALAATAVCVASIAYFIVPVSRWFALKEPIDITDIGVFVILVIALSLLVDAQGRARERAVESRRQIEDYARKLEREVAERQRAEEALRQSNTDLEDFSHIVSHDLKEPLRGIMMTAKFALDDHGDKLPPDGRRQLETLVRLPTRLAEMLDALLDYSRVWRSDLGITETDLGAVVAEVIDSLRPWLAEHHAQVTVAGKLPTLRCDRIRVAQIFSNLIANGVKYNKSEPKRIEIGARDGALYVKDNGIGIPPEKIPQIFRMFRRLHGQDQYGGGTGSGLALVKKTVERHGGRVWVESAPGQGSTFLFTLTPDQQATLAEVKLERRVSA